MSAFVVSDECMGVILTAVKRYADKLPFYLYEINPYYILDWLGNNLLAFNWESVNTLYKENDPYVYRYLEPKKLSYNFMAKFLMFKQVECWRYQSNECEGYFNCWQFDLMTRLRDLICNDILENLMGTKPKENPEENAEIIKKTFAYRSIEMWG